MESNGKFITLTVVEDPVERVRRPVQAPIDADTV